MRGYMSCYCVYYRGACAIEDPDNQKVIITGGGWTRTTVSIYGLQGWLEDLQPLNTGRYWHACSSYLSGMTRVSVRGSVGWTRYTALFAMQLYYIQVFLVTGGRNVGDILNSTEVYDPIVGSWVLTEAELPTPMINVKATNIDNRVLIFGW